MKTTKYFFACASAIVISAFIPKNVYAVNMCSQIFATAEMPAINSTKDLNLLSSQGFARDIVLKNLSQKDSKNQEFITKLWEYMRLKVWTKEQAAVAQKLVNLGNETSVNADQFMTLMTKLKELSGDNSKSFAEFEKYPTQYASLLKSQYIENLQFYGPKHVVLYIATSGNWSSPVARQVQSMAEGKAALSQSKNQMKDLPNPMISSVKDLKSIEGKIANEALIELSWKDSDFKAILSAIKEFQKGAQFYRQGNSAQSDIHINSAIDSIVSLSSSNPGMRPISKQDAYSLLSRASGGGLRIKQSKPEVLLHAIAALAKRSGGEVVEQLHNYITLRISVESTTENPLMGDRSIEAMKILNLTPEQIFNSK